MNKTQDETTQNNLQQPRKAKHRHPFTLEISKKCLEEWKLLMNAPLNFWSN